MQYLKPFCSFVLKQALGYLGNISIVRQKNSIHLVGPGAIRITWKLQFHSYSIHHIVSFKEIGANCTFQPTLCVIITFRILGAVLKC